MIDIYSLKEDSNEFEKEKLNEGDPLISVLDSNKTLLFVDKSNKKVWVWEGKNVSTRTKFLSSQQAPHIRDQYDIEYTMATVDEGDETAAFKVFIGLV